MDIHLRSLIFALVALCPVAAAAQQAPVAPLFVEETASAGIDSNYAGEWEFMVGGGAATFDCNTDGFPDMLLAGGSAPAIFYRNTSTRGGPLQFVAEKSGLELASVTGAYPLDIDSDGMMDLVLLRVGENVVMRGTGECRFERANEAFGFDGGDAWSTALAATWEKGQDWPTIAVGNYIDRTQEISPWGSCTDNWLHRPAPAAKGRFEKPLSLKPSFCALSMLFTDWNRSGTPSLRVSNDREYYEGGTEQMWHVDPGRQPALYNDAEGWKRLRIWGMGIAGHDLDFDGLPEYFLTSMADNKLQKLVPAPNGGAVQPNYRDIAFEKGVTAHRPFQGDDLRPSTAWHTQFEDVNNDALADLFIAKGNVEKMPDFAMKDPNNLLVQGPDGKFKEMAGTAGVASTAVSRGAALTDFNLDGLVDLVVVNRNEKAQVWRNATVGAGNWIALRPQQERSNRDGVGAWLEVKLGGKTLRRELTVGGGHAGGQTGWWHFGLADAKTVQIRILWPDNAASDWEMLEANQFYVVSRTKRAAKWQPPR